MQGIHRAMLAYKEHLPARSKKPNYPSILWTWAPHHSNFPGNWNVHRTKFNQCIEKLVPLFEEMSILKLIKVWDPSDPAFFQDGQFTAKGLTAYWGSVDSAFRHWDTFVYHKQARKTLQAVSRQQNFSSTQGNGQRRPNDFVSNEMKRYKKFKSSGNVHWQKRQPMPMPPLKF